MLISAATCITKADRPGIAEMRLLFILTTEAVQGIFSDAAAGGIYRAASGIFASMPSWIWVGVGAHKCIAGQWLCVLDDGVPFTTVLLLKCANLHVIDVDICKCAVILDAIS